MLQNLPFYMYFIIFLVATVVLIVNADRFVGGASGIAQNFGLSPMIIGLTVLSFGTSAPEILVSANAALAHQPGLAVGNAIGSNLANVGLVLGVTSFVYPLAVKPQTVKGDLLIMLAITAVAGFVLWDEYLGRYESLLLVAVLFSFLVYLFKTAKQHPELNQVEEQTASTKKATWECISGLVLLLVSSNLLVISATEIAQGFGVSPLLIGITVVAVGTSLPELAASITSALKGHTDMAIGNVIGSNIFNIGAVLPMAGIIYPSPIQDVNFFQNFGFMALICLVFFAFSLYAAKTKSKLSKVCGSVLLLLYIGYYVVLLT